MATKDEDLFPEEVHPAQLRATALRDAVAEASRRLASGETAAAAAAVPVQAALAALEPDDLGGEQPLIARQLRACLRHLEAVPADAEPGTHGSANDARFLKDMAEFLTRRFGLVEVEPGSLAGPQADRRQLPVLRSS